MGRSDRVWKGSGDSNQSVQNFHLLGEKIRTPHGSRLSRCCSTTRTFESLNFFFAWCVLVVPHIQLFNLHSVGFFLSSNSSKAAHLHNWPPFHSAFTSARQCLVCSSSVQYWSTLCWNEGDSDTILHKKKQPSITWRASLTDLRVKKKTDEKTRSDEY